MNAYEVPFEPNPQSFAITMGGVPYKLSTIWNTSSLSWTLDIADANGTPIVRGIPIVTGCDLLGQFGYLGFKGKLFVQNMAAPSVDAAYSELGSNVQVFFVVP